MLHKRRFLINFFLSNIGIIILGSRAKSSTTINQKNINPVAVGGSSSIDVANFHASGSDKEYIGALDLSSGDHIFLGEHDFKVGQGVRIFGIGTITTLPLPSKPLINLKGAEGKTKFSYVLAYMDLNGSITSVGEASTIMNAPTTLNHENHIKLEIIEKPKSFAGILIYRSINNSEYKLLHIAGSQIRFFTDRNSAQFESLRFKGIPPNPVHVNRPGFITTTIIKAGKDYIKIAYRPSKYVEKVLVLHDDTQAIQETFSLANKIKGTKINFTEGIYLVSRINCGSSLHITSNGKNVILKRQSLALDGDHWAGNGIIANRLDIQYNGSGKFSGKSEDIVIEGLIFDGNKENNLVNGDWASGALVSIRGCKNIIIANNKFINSVNAGIDLAYSENLKFFDNYSGFHGKHFEQPSEPAIFGGSKDLSITKNFFENCTDGVNLIDVNNCLIESNRMVSCSIGYDLWGAKNTKVIKNKIEQNTVNGVSVFLEGNKRVFKHSYNVEISHNEIDGYINDSKSTNAGILAIDASNWIISDNIIKNCVHAVQIQRSFAESSLAGNIRIERNNIRSQKASGIVISRQNIGEVYIANNIIKDSTTNKYGLWGSITIGKDNIIDLYLIENEVMNIYATPGAWMNPIKIVGTKNIGIYQSVDKFVRNKKNDQVNNFFKNQFSSF